MVDRTLADFVKEALGRGASREDIEGALTRAGWRPEHVRSALAAYADTPFTVPVPLPRAYVSAREAFLYLLLFIALGVLAGHLGGLLFALIEILMPRDATPSLGRVQAASGAIRWAVAALAVALPLYLILTWRLIRARRRNPAMQGSRIRKWLTYLTLVIAASTLIGDLIAVFYNLLSGELTLRFLLKACVIAAIAGAIFLYYVRDAERDEDDAPISLLDRALGAGVTGVAIAASIAGVMLIESPAALRERERDGLRLDSLVHIAGAVDCYYTYEGDTPENLAEMRAALEERANTTALEYSCTWYEETDPATGAPFEYHRESGGTFEVCAVFDRASDEWDMQTTRRYSRRPDRTMRTFNAAHDAGRQCFTLEAVSLAEN